MPPAGSAGDLARLEEYWHGLWSQDPGELRLAEWLAPLGDVARMAPLPRLQASHLRDVVRHTSKSKSPGVDGWSYAHMAVWLGGKRRPGIGARSFCFPACIVCGLLPVRSPSGVGSAPAAYCRRPRGGLMSRLTCWVSTLTCSGPTAGTSVASPWTGASAMIAYRWLLWNRLQWPPACRLACGGPCLRPTGCHVWCARAGLVARRVCLAAVSRRGVPLPPIGLRS